MPRQTLLTKREQLVLSQIAQGKSTQETADSLERAHHTIKTQLARILKKMDAKNRTHMVVLAAQRGLIDVLGENECPHHQINRWFIEVQGRDDMWRVVNPSAGGWSNRISAGEARVSMMEKHPAMKFRVVKMRAYYFVDDEDETT